MSSTPTPLQGRTVAVTGASGFIGRHLVRVLGARGAKVVAVVRNPQKVPSLSQQAFAVRKADLADPEALAEAFFGVDAVVANAGLVSIGGQSRAKLIAANVVGTQNVLEAMARSAVGRAVYVSSALAYRPKAGHQYREDDPLRRATDRHNPLTHYAVSKACAEDAAWRIAKRLGIALSTARPHTVYGAYDQGSFTWWLQRFMRMPVTVFPTRLMLPAVYAGDLADGICRMLERPAAIGKAYNLSGDPDQYDFWALMKAYQEAGGRVPRLIVPIPFPMRRGYCIDRATKELGWHNRAPHEGFRETLQLDQRSA